MIEHNSTWTIDPGHSNVQFKVKHLGIANVTGTFSEFEGKAVCENEDFANTEITFTLETDSLATNNEKRDEHLKGDMFFDVANFPKITFTGLLKKNEKGYMLAGDLTIRNIKKDIQLLTEITGIGMGRWGDTRAGFTLSGKISRKDFGITLEILTGTGSLVVGEDITLCIDMELIKQ